MSTPNVATNPRTEVALPADDRITQVDRMLAILGEPPSAAFTTGTPPGVSEARSVALPLLPPPVFYGINVGNPLGPRYEGFRPHRGSFDEGTGSNRGSYSHDEDSSSDDTMQDPRWNPRIAGYNAAAAAAARVVATPAAVRAHIAEASAVYDRVAQQLLPSN